MQDLTTTTANNNIADIVTKSAAIFANSGAVLQDNISIAEKAVSVGNNILGIISDNNGQLNPELDDRCQKYLANCSARKADLEKARKPTTQIMDEVKKMFTEAEGKLDVKKSGTPAFQIQAYRDAYAKKLYEEEQERRRQEELKAKKAQEAIDIKAEVGTQLLNYFNNYLGQQKRSLFSIFEGLSLQNYDERLAQFQEQKFVYPYVHHTAFQPRIAAFYHNEDEIKNLVLNATLSHPFEQFATKFTSEMEESRITIIPLFPGKKAELEAMAKADEAQKAELLKQQQQREAEERQRMEEEQKRKEEEQRQQLAMQHAADSANTLFDKEAALAQTVEKPEARQGYEMKITHQVGYMLVFQFWFEREGKSLSLDKLEKKSLGQMVAFCEKHAHKTNEKIDSPYIKYEESFKAVNRKS